jgi:hypothetical protein
MHIYPEGGDCGVHLNFGTLQILHDEAPKAGVSH